MKFSTNTNFLIFHDLVNESVFRDKGDIYSDYYIFKFTHNWLQIIFFLHCFINLKLGLHNFFERDTTTMYIQNLCSQ